jgi:hypothetical protein
LSVLAYLILFNLKEDDMFKEYKTLQQTRMACKIEPNGIVEKVKPGVARYKNKTGAITELIEFSHDTKVKPDAGDYIVRMCEDDVYHVRKEVFEKSYRPTGFKLK